MKTLIIASSFAFAGFLSYGWINQNHSPQAVKTIYSTALQDTIPKKKDSLRNKKMGGDSLNKRDTSWPKRDSSGT